jgi:type I restriction enzyme M protein
MPANTAEIEKRLWDAADDLRANSKLKSSEYSMPVLGLIFLRYADYKFTLAEAAINVQTLRATSVRSASTRRKIGKIDYQARGVMYLPDESRFSRLLNLPEGADIAKAIESAMKAIEKENEALSGVLPKNYAHLDKSLLVSLLKSLNFDLSKAAGDVFGKIYEYFLGKFAMSEGQKGGEFFTPISLVTLIVEIIEPYHGYILDPANGSGDIITCG